MPDVNLLLELCFWVGLLISSGFGNPVPEEFMIIAAGIRTASTTLEPYGMFRWLLLPAVIVGAMGADILLYGVGRLFGVRLLEYPWLARLVPPQKCEQIRHNLHRYGAIIFVIGRLIPGIRTTLFLTAGMTRVSVFRFLLTDGLGALLGNSLIFLLAFWIGDQFRDLLEAFREQAIYTATRPAVLLVGLLAIGGYLLYRFWSRPIPTGDPEELPLVGEQVAAHLPHLDQEIQTNLLPTSGSHPALKQEQISLEDN